MICFTLCSNNYLAQAKVLGDSLSETNPGSIFIIGLVDKKSVEVDYDFFSDYEVVTIENIKIPDFEDLWKKFDIIELNTSVKPSFFKYLFNRFPAQEQFFYFDPDIMIFESLDVLKDNFAHSDILLTPHVLTPIPLDNLGPSENAFLNYGIYNLGFLGLKRSEEVFSFLDWWELRTLTLGFSDTCNGFFVDQLWINLVPIFFGKALILRSLGYNVGPWNLHERKEIESGAAGHVMQDGTPLVFYHFSSYNYKFPDQIARHYNRYNFTNCCKLKPLYTSYHNLLLTNKIELLSAVPCFYVKERAKFLENSESHILIIKKFGRR